MDINTLKTAAGKKIRRIGFKGEPDGGISPFTNGSLEYYNAVTSVDNGELKIEEISSGHFDTRYIRQSTKKVAYAEASTGQVMFTDQLTGCFWEIWKFKEKIVCAHAYNDGKFAASIESQAKSPDWVLKKRYLTAGKINKDNNEQCFAFSVINSNSVDTVIFAVKDSVAVRVLEEGTVARP